MDNFFGIQIYRKAIIYMPSDIVQLLNNIHKNLSNQSVEFGVYLKGVFDRDTMSYRIKSGNENVCFPRQRVSSVTMEFLEPPATRDFNVALHRHPNGVTGFSGTDQASINIDWEVSILFIPPDSFPSAIINIDIGPCSKIQIPADVKIVSTDAERDFKKFIDERIELAATVHRSFGDDRLKELIINQKEEESDDIIKTKPFNKFKNKVSPTYQKESVGGGM
jgi:hypothetical protein